MARLAARAKLLYYPTLPAWSIRLHLISMLQAHTGFVILAQGRGKPCDPIGSKYWAGRRRNLGN